VSSPEWNDRNFAGDDDVPSDTIGGDAVAILHQFLQLSAARTEKTF
jgi:hypothetical protein